MSRRIDRRSSQTAAWTCVSRAASSQETNPHLKSDDHIARELLPTWMKPLVSLPAVRTIFHKYGAPQGIYEYVIARTKYIDAVFLQVLKEGFDQILIFGAGFDTRALRFQENIRNTTIFELDIATTQEAKRNQYHKRKLTVPANLRLIPIDFDRDTLTDKLDQAGFQKGKRDLFILEGLIMYLQAESVDSTFHTIQEYAGPKSRIVFDYIYASVLRQENLYYGEAGSYKRVASAGEPWQFGIEKDNLTGFLSKFDLKLLEQKDSLALEQCYFTNKQGQLEGRINGTHCLVTVEK
ncbi:MAG: class I SAM-dependent methyltransferase [Anaerolineales bacterium]|nr:class I SAM-dependent methyltransferase [Anaerolineales bacterium]